MSLKTTIIEDIKVNEVRKDNDEFDNIILKQWHDIILLNIEQVRTLAAVLNEVV